MFEFDHFFTFVEPNFKYTNKALDNIKLGSAIEHKGQGTSAVFAIFNKFYLEWVWLSNLEDAKVTKPRADLRSDWVNSGWSPFGIRPPRN